MSGTMKIKAKEEIENLIEQAKKNIRAERDEMVADVRRAGADLVVSALEKILTEKIDDKKDRRLIEEMMRLAGASADNHNAPDVAFMGVVAPGRCLGDFFRDDPIHDARDALPRG